MRRAAALCTVLLVTGCAGGGRTAPGGPILPGGPLARASVMQAPAAPPDSLMGSFAVYRGDGRPAAPEQLAAALASAWRKQQAPADTADPLTQSDDDLARREAAGQ